MMVVVAVAVVVVVASQLGGLGEAVWDSPRPFECALLERSETPRDPLRVVSGILRTRLFPEICATLFL